MKSYDLLCVRGQASFRLAGFKIYYTEDSSYQDTFETTCTVQRSEFF